MTTEARDMALIADDEDAFREDIEKAIRQVFPEMDVKVYDNPRAICESIEKFRGSVRLVVSDGCMLDDPFQDPSDGEIVTKAAVKSGVPHVAYYSRAADSKAKVLAPLNIKPIVKRYPGQTGPLIEWLESIKNDQK